MEDSDISIKKLKCWMKLGANTPLQLGYSLFVSAPNISTLQKKKKQLNCINNINDEPPIE